MNKQMNRSTPKSTSITLLPMAKASIGEMICHMFVSKHNKERTGRTECIFLGVSNLLCHIGVMASHSYGH